METSNTSNTSNPATFGNILLGEGSFLQSKYEPCIIQSAFLLENGKRILIYTGALGIVSYECDENWKPFPKPFATCPKGMMDKTLTEYHQTIRKMHGEEKLVKEHSTEITW